MPSLFLCLLLAAITALGGCAATGPAFTELQTPNAGMGLLYVFRPPSLAAMGTVPHVFVDGVHRVDLRKGGYTVFELPSGSHHVEILGPTLTPVIKSIGEVDIDIAVGERRFVRWQPDVGFGYDEISFASFLETPIEAAALPELAACRQVSELPQEQRKNRDDLLNLRHPGRSSRK